MPVDTTHSEYDAFREKWSRCRDANGGSDDVKARGGTYLPKLDSQSDDEYTAYKMRALWYGATARTVNGLVGAVTRKDPQFSVPDAMLHHLKDITNTGTPLTVFSKQLMTELLKTGRGGVLLDRPAQSAPEIPSSTRPYWTMYGAEAILNWRTDVRNGARQLALVVLREAYDKPDPDDLFTVTCETRYRVLMLENGQYVQKLYTPRESSGRADSDYDITLMTPNFRETPLDYIPFCFFGVTGLEPSPERPPLLDLVDVNISHYRSSADLEHGRHFTALPTPWIAGFPKETKLKIGSTVAWVATDPQAHAGMLEFTGQGLQALDKALETKEQLMAVLGARMLEEQKAGVEASDALAMRSSGERSVLQSMAVVVGLGLTLVLRWHAKWMGIQDVDAINAELNSDFLSVPLTGPELTGLFQVYQGGGMSFETFYWNLQRGEVARPDTTAEDERDLVEKEMAQRLIDQANVLTDPADEQEEEDDAIQVSA